MSAAILGGLPVVAAAAVGAACWAARVALAVPRKPAPERVDLSRLGHPWRAYVQEAMLAQGRFQQAVRQTPPGPLHDRLAEVGVRLGEGVMESWRVARRGQDLQMAMASLDVAGIRRELAQCQAEQQASWGARGRPQAAATAGGGGSGGGPAEAPLDRTVRALESQLASAARIQAIEADARERLRLLNAQLDEAVAEAVELSVKGIDQAGLGALTDSVDTMVSELQALRQGLDEVGASSPS
jgi:hypothetical protein